MIKLRGRDRRARRGSPASSITPSATASGSTTGSPTRSQFQEAIEQVVVPLARQLQEERAQALGVETLRPWDLSVDPLGRPPLRPVRRRRDSWPRGPRRSSRDVDPELGRQFAYLRTHGLLDLANRKGKAPGGYQTTLEDDRLPVHLHERRGPRRRRPDPAPRGGPRLPRPGQPGRAAGRLSREPDRVLRGRLDVDGAPRRPRTSSAFYDEDDADRSYRQLLEGIVLILPWIATVDAFQHWIYTHPDHTRDERKAAWTALLDRFGGHRRLVGLRGGPGQLLASPAAHLPLPVLLHRVRDRAARRPPDLAASPRDRAGAVADYRNALALGGSRPLPELFAAAGIRFDFREETLAPLMEAINEELTRMGQ